MRTPVYNLPAAWQTRVSDWRPIAVAASVTILVAVAAPSQMLRMLIAAAAMAGLVFAIVAIRSARRPSAVRTRIIDTLPAVSWLGDVPLMPGGRLSAGVGGFVREPRMTTSMHAVAARLPGASRRDSRRILFTSATSGAGKTTIAMNTAAALARTHRVLLIDANLRVPGLSRALNLATYDGGLSELIARAAPYRACLALTGTPNLHVIRSGSLPADPGDVLLSTRLERTLALSMRYYDRVIIDSPALSDCSDAATLAALVDDVVLVVDAQRPGFEDVTRARETLNRVNANIAGFVLNKVSD